MSKKDNKATESASQAQTSLYASQQQATGTTTADAIAQAEKKIRATKRNVIIAVVALLVVIVAGVCIWLFAFGGAGHDDGAQIEGQAPYKSEEEMQAESEREIAEGMFNISIATRIEFENANSEGLAYIENVPNNPYDMRVVITEDETGDVLYESGVITPNHYIEKIRLNKALDAGEHAATATFTARDKETQEEAGQAAGAVTLIIGE